MQAAALRMTRLGYAATTLDDVADDAGVTKGALYHYFSSKEDLVVAVIARMKTISPGKDAAARSPKQRLAAAAKSAAAGIMSREDEALNHDLYGLAMRNADIRKALGDRTRATLEEIVDDQGLSLDFIIAASALVEGLTVKRMLLPDLVSEELLGRALTALATMLEPPETNRSRPAG